MQIQVTDYLCWERAQLENPDNFFPEPQQLKTCLPQWFRDLPANLKNLNLPESTNQSVATNDRAFLGGHGYRSAKLCLGLRGIRTVGWTIPITHDLTVPYYGHNVSRKETMLHPAMLTGSGFDQLREDGCYEWEIRIVSFPWRARMAPGWRLMITAHPLTWSRDWFCFSGCVDANYRHNGTNIGAFWNFDYKMDLSQNYYNIELVIAIRSLVNQTMIIPKETCLFSMVPLYDPDYQATEFKEFPHFTN